MRLLIILLATVICSMNSFSAASDSFGLNEVAQPSKNIKVITRHGDVKLNDPVINRF